MNLLGTALLLLASPPAFASDPIEGEAAPWEAFDRHLDAESEGRRGFYLEGGASLGGCTDELCGRVLDAGIGAGGRIGLGYRFAPLFSLGMSLDLQSVPIDANDVGCDREAPCRTTEAGASWQALSLAGRFHLTRTGSFDPWAGFLVGGATASAEAERQRGTASPEALEGNLSGGTLGIEVGLAWLPVSRFALTLSARALYVVWTDACFTAGGTTHCGEGAGIQGTTEGEVVTKRDLPALWSISLGVRVMP